MRGSRWPTWSEGAVGSTPTYAPTRFSVRSQSRVERPLCVHAELASSMVVPCRLGVQQVQPRALTPQHLLQSHAPPARSTCSAVFPTVSCPPALPTPRFVLPRPTLRQPILWPVVHHAATYVVAVYSLDRHTAAVVTSVSATTWWSESHESQSRGTANIEKGMCQGDEMRSLARAWSSVIQCGHSRSTSATPRQLTYYRNSGELRGTLHPH
jgi:hypothetical protein